MNDTLLLLLTYPLTAFVTWFFTRKKVAAEAKATEIDNSAKICEMWRNLSEGMEKRFKEEMDDLRSQNNSLEIQVKEVLCENVALRKRVQDVEQENVKLTAQLKILNKKNK